MPAFTFNIQVAATLLTALANAQRLTIVRMLIGGERDVSSMAAELDMSQSALSQHLKKMRDAKLVKTRRSAQTVFYSLQGREAARVLTSPDEIFSPPTVPFHLDSLKVS